MPIIEIEKPDVQILPPPEKKLERPKKYAVMVSQEKPLVCHCVAEILTREFNISSGAMFNNFLQLRKGKPSLVLVTTKDIAETKAARANQAVAFNKCPSIFFVKTNFYIEPA
jgi:ATP-dependent Clp protease adapter protein ClpS